MLPRRKPKAPKRSSRWRSQRHLAFVRDHACCNCDSISGIEAAHVRIGSGAGMGQKPDDWRAVSLCRDCHSLQHSLGEWTFWNDYWIEKKQTVEQLINSFCKASPVARVIKEVQNGKGMV